MNVVADGMISSWRYAISASDLPRARVGSVMMSWRVQLS